MKLAIGIKALNEERRIAASLESAIAAAKPWKAQVILADCGSTDRTVEVAATYPVKIVQLSNLDDASCGAGAQLAFQFATSDYFYLLDGDMVMDENFLPSAIEALDADPGLAAVGGLVTEINLEGHDFQIRSSSIQSGSNWGPGPVDRLDCGGLYRMSAVRQVGYFADRNLDAFEEFDLAARLQSWGWRLARIDRNAVKHYGHQTNGYRLLVRRLRSGYATAHGQVLRAAIGGRHLPLVLRNLAHLRHSVLVHLWWVALLCCAFIPASIATKAVAFSTLLVAPLFMLFLRRKSLRLGVYSLAAWNVSALGLILGVARKRVNPHIPLPAVIVKD